MAKTILITGASSGFGEATAHLFAKLGWQLVLVARRQERCDAIKDQYKDRQILTLSLDVRDQKKIFDTLPNLPAPFHEIDVLVNSAGLALGLEPAYRADIHDWNTMVDTNIKGLIYCSRALLPQMVARKQGHIVNIGSISGSWPYPGGNVYGATKAFVKQFSNNLRAELIDKNIRITNIEPGRAKTEFSVVRFKGDYAKADSVYAGYQALTSEDIAQTIAWVVQRPAHVNVNSVEIMPTCQAWGRFNVHRS